MERLLIIDGNSLINRAFYALPLLTNNKGEYSNGVYGFTNMLIKAINEYKPTHIAVAFDYGKKTFRHNLFSEYKGTRKETPFELKGQFSLLKRLLKAMNIKLIEQEGIEADDILGTMCKATEMETFILSGDRDVFQLIDSTTKVMFTKKGITEVEIIGEEELLQSYNLTPSQVIDFKALSGDSSDNIPGVKGIGEKSAKSLLEKYGSVEGIYENIQELKGALKEKLENGKEMAYLSKILATIKTDCDISFDINDCKYDFPFSKEVFDIFCEYEFKSLIKHKEYFLEDFTSEEFEEIPCQEIEIDNLSKLLETLKYSNENKYFCLNLTPRIEFSFNENFRYVIKNEISLFDSVSNEDIKQNIIPILKDKSITKIFFDYKKALHFFEGVEPSGIIHDIQIANYLVGESLNENIHTNSFVSKIEELKNKMELLGVLDIYLNMEMPLARVLYEMEVNGFRIDTKMLNEIAYEMEQEKEKLISLIEKMAGEKFNLNSPKQLQHILFDVLLLPTTFNKKRSTGVDVLDDLEPLHPIISLIKKYRKIQKILSTYVDVYKELTNNGEDIIHTIYNQTLTSTGRLSSSEPNLQNIPVRDDEGKVLRKMFVSRFDGGTIMSADYSQIELRLLANFSKDETLLDAYKNNVDIHTMTASKVLNKNPKDITSEERRTAKAVNFGIIYGISDYGLSQNLKIPVKVAKQYIDDYFLNYPKVKEYMNLNIQNAKLDGYVKTYYGRIRRIPEIKASNYQTRAFGERVAMNMPLQGSASDIIKLAMVRLNLELKKNNMKSLLILTIHDELILDVYPGEEVLAGNVLKESMENVVKFEVPLLVELSSGKTWFDAK